MLGAESEGSLTFQRLKLTQNEYAEKHGRALDFAATPAGAV